MFADGSREPFWSRSGQVCQGGYPAGVFGGKVGQVLRRGEYRDGESQGGEGGLVEVAAASRSAQVRGCPDGTGEVGQSFGAAFAGQDAAAAADGAGPVQEAEQGDRGVLADVGEPSGARDRFLDPGDQVQDIGTVRCAPEVLPEDAGGPLRGAGGLGEPGVSDQGFPAAGQVDGERQPPAGEAGGRSWGEVAAVLVVAAGELDVVEDDPDVGGVELGEGGQAGQEVGLVDGAQQSCHG
jgi:hypothetical protein